MPSYLYEPSDWGKVYHGLTLWEALGAGSAGPGKTTVLRMDPTLLIRNEHNRCQLPRSNPAFLEWGSSLAHVLFLRRTASMLDQTIARSHSILMRMDPGARWVKSQTGGTFTFQSGLKYQFDSCKDITSYEKYMSNEYTRIMFDELNQFDEEQYDQIKTRCRTSDKYLKPFLAIRSMSNPVLKRDSHETFVVKDPYWVRRYFVDPAPGGNVILSKRFKRKDGRSEKRSRIYLPATLHDNPDKEFVETYELNLMDSKPHIRAALLYGDWYLTENSYYGDVWNRRIHVCRPFKIPSGWWRFRSMDWGFKLPGCVHWWAVSPEGVMFCEREMTFQGRYDVDVADAVIATEKKLGIGDGYGSKLGGPADTQLWEKRGEDTPSKAEAFEAKGVFWEPASKGRLRSAELLSARFAAHENFTREPGIVFFNTCKQAISTIPGIPIDSKYPDDGPLDTKNDHWHDSICYAVSYVEQNGIGYNSNMEDGFFDEEDDIADRGDYGYGIAV
jgi:hypothetical protein